MALSEGRGIGSRQLSTFGPKDQNVFVPMIDLQNTGANCFRPYDRPPKQGSIIFSNFQFLHHLKSIKCDTKYFRIFHFWSIIFSIFPFLNRIFHFKIEFPILFSNSFHFIFARNPRNWASREMVLFSNCPFYFHLISAR